LLLDAGTASLVSLTNMRRARLGEMRPWSNCSVTRRSSCQDDRIARRIATVAPYTNIQTVRGGVIFIAVEA